MLQLSQRGSCYYPVSIAVQMFSLSATPSHYTSWSFRSSIITEFLSCISQYACCTCFRKHTAWWTNHHTHPHIKLCQPQLWEWGQSKWDFVLMPFRVQHRDLVPQSAKPNYSENCCHFSQQWWNHKNGKHIYWWRIVSFIHHHTAS